VASASSTAAPVVATLRPKSTSLVMEVLGLRLSYMLCDNWKMADTITFRPDEDASRALAVLTQDGTPVSAAVRSALIRAARAVAAERLRAEAAELTADEADRAEAAQVLRDMETLRAW
jgi:hypothetical protein